VSLTTWTVVLVPGARVVELRTSVWTGAVPPTDQPASLSPISTDQSIPVPLGSASVNDRPFAVLPPELLSVTVNPS